MFYTLVDSALQSLHLLGPDHSGGRAVASGPCPFSAGGFAFNQAPFSLPSLLQSSFHVGPQKGAGKLPSLDNVFTTGCNNSPFTDITSTRCALDQSWLEAQ